MCCAKNVVGVSGEASSVEAADPEKSVSLSTRVISYDVLSRVRSLLAWFDVMENGKSAFGGPSLS